MMEQDSVSISIICIYSPRIGLGSRSFKQELKVCSRTDDARDSVDFHETATKLPRNLVPTEEKPLVGPERRVTV